MANQKHALQASEADRLDLLRAIGKKRGSTVITYFTSTRAGAGGSAIEHGDIEILEWHVRAAKRAGAKTIDLFLSTHGGHTVAPWNFLAMVRDYFRTGTFNVLLPHRTYSAGTMIALGADEIVMGPSSVLGPVDTSSGWKSANWYGAPRASAVQGLFALLDELGLKPGADRKTRLEGVTSDIDPIALGELYRLWKENERLVMNALTSRKQPLSAAANTRLAEFFLSGVGIHSQGVRRIEARKAGLKYATDLEGTGLETEVVTLFTHYADLMKLFTPFARPTDVWEELGNPGDEYDYDAFGEHASSTPIAMIESEYDTNPAYVAYGLRHWNETPPLPQTAQPQGEEQAPVGVAAAKPFIGWGSRQRSAVGRGTKPGA